MKPLILGAGGILGCSLCQHFRRDGVPLTGLTHAELDITRTDDVKRLLEQHGPDTVLNAAAMTAVDRCEGEKEIAFAINAEAPARIAGLCRERGIRFIHFSSDYVFDGRKRIPYTEEDIPAPLSVYAASKFEGEKRVMEANPAALVVRVAWTFRKGGGTFLCRLREMVLEQEHLQVANDRVGNCTYAPDLAAAADQLAQNNVSGLVHVTNEGDLSWFDFAVVLRETALRMGLFPRCQKIMPISSASLNLPARRPTYSVLDKSRYHQLTGNTMRPWRETLCDFLRESV